jgi:polygalacturonase
MPMMPKRQFIKAGLAAALPLALWRCSSAAGPVDAISYPPRTSLDVLWDQADAIERDLARTGFSARTFAVTAFAAHTGGQGDLNTARHNRAAFQRAIDACHQAGGGRILVPAGIWPCGALTLKSNVELHLQQDALLAFHPATELYLPLVFTRWEGMELMGYQPLIYAFGAENIGLTGEGTIDGGGSNSAWWPWKGQWKHTPWPVDDVQVQHAGRNLLMQWVEQGKPVAERVLPQNFLRPPLFQVYQCHKVLVEGLTLQNSPFWVLNPVLSEDVLIRRVKVVSHGPNSDGCDPESCRRVLIEHCLFDTGDDCIALKSGRNADGRRINRPVEQVLVQDCTMKAGHGGVVIGSEISGGANHIFARRLLMSSPHLDRGLRIKTNALRGGLIDTVALRDIVIGEVKDVIVVNYFYEEGRAGQHLPTVRNIFVHNLQVDNAQRLFELRGFAEAQIGPLQLSSVRVNCQSIGVLDAVGQLDCQQVLVNGQPWRFLGETATS